MDEVMATENAPLVEVTVPECVARGCDNLAQEGGKWCKEHQEVYDKRMKEKIAEERLIKLRENDFIVREAKLKAEADKVKRQAEHDALVQQFEPMAENGVDQILESIDLKAEAVRTRLPFIGASGGEFSQRVPFYRDNLILIGAMTGQGKTTVMAAIAYRLILEGRLPLIMTNETSNREFFIALACLSLGGNYRKFSTFTPEQVAAVKEEIKRLGPKVRVIDQLSVPGGTTSVTGLKIILDKINSSAKKPDAVLLDYLQGISEGYMPSSQSFEIQHDAAEILWSFILKTGIPVVAFSQLHPKDKQKSTLEDRIKLGKHILTRVTFAIEYIPQYKDLKTGEPYENPRALWRPWKIREMSSAEELRPFFTMFNHGQFGEPEAIEGILMRDLETAEEKKASGKAED